MNFHQNNSRLASTARPLPSGMPEYILVELKQSVFRDQPQWSATYKMYGNGRASDDIDLVVNFNLRQEPEVGDWWWVKPTSMAPQKRLVFAEATERVGEQRAPLTVRIGDQLILDFVWSPQEECNVASHNGWKVVLSGEHLTRNETWRVVVKFVRLSNGTIFVDSVGPHPKAIYRPPAKVGYLSVTALSQMREVIETDVLTYSSWYHDRQGGSFAVEVEHGGKILMLQCTQLRTCGKQLVGVVSLPGQATHYLAELVLIEGEPVGLPPAPVFHQPAPPAPRARVTRWSRRSYLDDLEDEQEFLRELWENDGGRPDSDYD